MSLTLTRTAPASADREILPGYHVDAETGAWLSLPWPVDAVSIGSQVVDWCERWLTSHRESDPETGRPMPWRFTQSQLRFVHLWFALRGPGPKPSWLFRSAVKRGAKGTGKDPLLAVMALAELCGPTLPVWHKGRWVGTRHRMPLVQIAANSEAQAKDPLRIANAMVNVDMAAEFGFDKGILRTQIDGGGMIELLTNSEASAEGDPATAVFFNESHHMTHTSGGQRLAGVGRRNVGKSPGGLARACEFTNAHMPGEGSVAEDSYEAWQAQVGGKTRRRDILYDSREAPPHLSLLDEDQLMEGLRAAYADAPWVDLERIRDEAQDPRVPLADSIRFYFSSLPTSEDAWIDPRKFDAKRTEVVIEDGEAVALFVDCSKSSDATVFDGCRISDGHSFGIQGWQRPHGDRGKGWLAPRHEVDAAVRAAFERWDVQWFGVDPSPARDDEDEALYWAELVDEWHRDFRDTVLVWATPGAKGSAVAFDMRQSIPGGKDRLRMITEECELTQAAIDGCGECPACRAGRECATTSALTWDGDAMFRQHVHNARRRPNMFGVSIGKQSRSSSKLIDHAFGMVGARLGRRLVLNSGKVRKKRSGRAMFV
jgi:hypothetical protein